MRDSWLLVSLVLCLYATPSLQNLGDNQVDDDEGSDFLDLASSFLQNAAGGGGNGGGAGLAAIGGVLSTLMQGDAGKNIGDMLAGVQMGNNNNNAAADVLSGISSLFADKNGNLDPSIIGSVISSFAESAMAKNEDAAPQKKRASKKQAEDNGGIDMGALLNLAAAFMNNQNQGQKKSKSKVEKSPMDELMQNLPSLLLNVLSTFNSPEAARREHDHSDHAWFLPPIFEKVHVFWDHFINSELGKAIWENAGLSELTKTFTDKNTGRLDFEIIFKSLENHSFRRKWIKKATNYMAEWVVHLANPDVQQKYLASSQFMVNGFLKSQGFPKHITLQPNKLSESITNIINYSLKKYLDSPQDVSIYIKPAVQYAKDLLKTAQKSHGAYLQDVNKNELSDKLTDTLNLEIIEPVLKAYRAYRFARKAPHCQKHVLCVINNQNDSENIGLPGFKAGLTKLSSLVASAALSYNGGQSFLGLYQAIQDGTNCHAKYPAECDAFHEEELRVTTEYSHNEL